MLKRQSKSPQPEAIDKSLANVMFTHSSELRIRVIEVLSQNEGVSEDHHMIENARSEGFFEALSSNSTLKIKPLDASFLPPFKEYLTVNQVFSTSIITKSVSSGEMPIVLANDFSILYQIKDAVTGVMSGGLFWAGGPSVHEDIQGNSGLAAMRTVLLPSGPKNINKKLSQLENGQAIFFGTYADPETIDVVAMNLARQFYEIDEIRMFGIGSTIDAVISQMLTYFPSGIWLHISADHFSPDTESSSQMTAAELREIVTALCASGHLLGISISDYDNTKDSDQNLLLMIGAVLNIVFSERQLRRTLIPLETHVMRQKLLRASMIKQEEDRKKTTKAKNLDPREPILRRVLSATSRVLGRFKK